MTRSARPRTRACIAALAFALGGCSYLLDTDSLSSRAAPSNNASVGDASVADTSTGEDGPADVSAPQDAQVDADASDLDGTRIDARTSLVAEWLFDDLGADAAVDTTGNSHVGQLFGSATLTGSGKRNGALVVDGGGKLAATSLDYVAFPRSGTLAMWLYVDAPTGDGGARALFDVYEQTRDHLFMRQLPSGNGMTLQVVGQWNDGGYAAEFRPELTPDVWTHIAFTWDEAGRESHMFINGVDQARKGWGPLTFAPTQQLVRLADGFIGRVDEVRLYDRPLTTAEIAAQM